MVREELMVTTTQVVATISANKQIMEVKNIDLMLQLIHIGKVV